MRSALVVAVALALGACGDDDDGTTTDVIDACALVSTDELEAMTGTAFAPPTATDPTGSRSSACDHHPVDVANATVQLVSVSVRPASEYDSTVEIAGTPTPVDGFSVEAAATDSGLMLRYDEHMIVVIAITTTGDQREVEQAVGHVVDERFAAGVADDG